MKFDTTLLATDLSQIPQLTRQAEAIGFDGIWVAETAHDAFLPLTLAAEHSRHLSLGTSIALAFSRSPAVLAYLAWDLARFSQGRFIMGLGTQTNNHFQ
jgi:alkanesulfonate monooxygenase SsuD/methylene tetrahydromethanopterin reductase-like flavin-dependent oxidoreductase (luciferase family)